MPVNVKSDEPLPWSRPPEMAKKPAGIEYAYVIEEDGKPVLKETDREGLIEKVANGEAMQVVVPELETLAPPSIVEELWPAVQERERGRRESERKNAFFNVLLFGGITLYSFKSDDPAWQMVLIMFVIFGLIPLVQYLLGAARRKLQGEGTFEEMRDRTYFGFWLGVGDVPTSRWCVRGLIAVFVVQVLASAIPSGNIIRGIVDNAFFVGQESVDAGALTKPLNGDYWRLMTCGLLHGGLLHIGFNGMALKSVGEIIERFYGGAVLLITFVISVFAGSIASVVLMPGKPSVGASGGIMGMVGFLLVVGLRHRESLPADFAKSLIRSVLFMAAIGFLAKDFIDNAAHAGGFLAGCLVALPLSKNVRDLGERNGSLVVDWGGRVAEVILYLTAAYVIFRLVAAGGLI